ncbi:MAG: hypothetical protein RI894_766 [Bacteroidota bacterium]|jgi:BirA family biotin operon repressor/biotin-[acetyl-CoA-carboxylase] ligase
MALFIGTSLHLFEKLPSTNSYAQEMLTRREAVAEGTLIQAFEQTAGRGQQGTIWQSDAGQNLTFSIILRPTFLPINEQFSLNQAISLAVIDFLTPYIKKNDSKSEPRIKWSNDILIGEKKICGILIENSIQNRQLATTILGIGLNINQLDFENLPQATSLRKITGAEYDLAALRQELCDCIEARYLQLRRKHIKQLEKDYLAVLYRFGEDACYERTATNAIFWARIIGITPEGKLEILHQGGVDVFSLKEIKFL